jgi:P63C domain
LSESAGTNQEAKKWSELGASKGGRARANVLTPQERREIAQQAVRTRWLKAGKLKQVEDTEDRVDERAQEDEETQQPPFSMFRGTLKMGDLELECHVLNDGRRVLTQREVVRAISGGRESGNLGRYLDRNPLTASNFQAGPVIRFNVPGVPQTAIGYEATLLIEICDKYLEARDQKLLKGRQYNLASQAEIIIRACAKVGIIALIDEATGYEKVRAKNALQLKLQAFIADDLQEWARMFPEEFWYELARLEGVRYSARSRPLRWGKYVMMFVYDAIDPDVGRELRKKNPNPRFMRNHHQWLKQFGRDKVHDQIQRVVTIMKLCEDMDDFREKFAKVFKKTPLQLSFDDLSFD